MVPEGSHCRARGNAEVSSLLNRCFGARRPAARVAHLAGAACVVGAIIAIPTVANAVGSVQVSDFGPSLTVVSPNGGADALNAVVVGGGTCTISVSPRVTGFPKSVGCSAAAGKSSRQLHVAVLLPADAAAKPVHYTWSLRASPQGSSATVTKTTAIEVEAYKLAGTVTALSLPPATTAISCAGKSFCVGVGTGGAVTVLDATGSHDITDTDTSNLTAVSCAGPAMCAILDKSGRYLTLRNKVLSSANTLYQSGSTTPVDLGAVSCPTTTFCMAVDGAGDALNVAGSTGVVALASFASTSVGSTGVSCSSATRCTVVAIDGDGFEYLGAKGWTATTGLLAHGSSVISCSSDGDCRAVDSEGYSFDIEQVLNVTGTALAAKENEMTPRLRIGAVSCVSASFCLASDGTGFFAVAGGTVGGRITVAGGSTGKWTAPSCVPSSGSLNVAVCTTVNRNFKKGRVFAWHVALLK